MFDVKPELLGYRFKCVCGNVFRVGTKSDKSKNKAKLKRLTERTSTSPELNQEFGINESEPTAAEWVDCSSPSESLEALHRFHVDGVTDFERERDFEEVTVQLDEPEQETQRPDYSTPMVSTPPPPMIGQTSTKYGALIEGIDGRIHSIVAASGAFLLLKFM